MTANTPEPSCSNGNNAVERFSALFELHGRAIYGHIRALVPNFADADEVFQETNLTLWQKLDQYLPETDFRAWAFRIAYYKVLKLRDERIRSPRLFSPEFLDIVSEQIVVMSEMLDARTEAMLLCRDKLNRRDRGLLDRFHREGATVKDVARWIKKACTTSTARFAASTTFCSTASKRRSRAMRKKGIAPILPHHQLRSAERISVGGCPLRNCFGALNKSVGLLKTPTYELRTSKAC